MQQSSAKRYVAQVPSDAPARAVSAESARRLAGSLWSHVPFAAEAYELVLRAGAFLGARRVHPDTVTALALLSCVACGVAAGLGHSLLAVALYLSGGVLDLLDGAIARATRRVSARGALLDSTADRVADAAPLLGLIYAYRELGAAVLAPAAALLGSFLVSYVHARSASLELDVHVAFPRRAERTLLVTAALVAQSFTPALALPFVSVALLLIVALFATTNAVVAVLRARD